MRISKQTKRVKFSKILEQSKQCTVYLPSNISDSLECISYIVAWNKRFDLISFITLDEFIKFFRNLDLPESIQFMTDPKKIDNPDRSIVINLQKSRKIKSHSKKTEKVIFDINNTGNIHLLPSPDSYMELIYEISYYCQLPYSKAELAHKTDQPDQYAIPFVQNQMNNFVFHTSRLTYLPQLIGKIKEKANGNFYVCSKINGKLQNMGVRTIQPSSVYELFMIAKKADAFLTDDADIYDVFAKYGVKTFRLPSKWIMSANNGQIKNLLNEIYMYIFNKQ